MTLTDLRIAPHPLADPRFKRVVLASNNPGKLREFAALFAGIGIELISQREFDVSEAEEPHVTFIENALAKARHAAQATGLPALADDSGLCVRALGGAPGVLSARYGQQPGAPKSDEANKNRLLAEIANLTDRRAHFVCALALVATPADPEPLVVDAAWHGEVISDPRGRNGFGYDPFLYIPDLQATAAELAPEVKNRHSHRARALRKLIAKLDGTDDRA